MHLPGTNYQLVDFGDGRKLELIESVLVDRPCEAAENYAKMSPKIWQQTALRFDAGRANQWEVLDRIPVDWRFRTGRVELQLKPTPFGHLGVFPEQGSNWQWFERLFTDTSNQAPKCLNLFAYTGASTLVLAALGCAVTHVDSSRPTLQWARTNCSISGLESAPIRWIQEDAKRFVDREVRRGNRYDIVLLDPPSYGHGPKGEVWDFDNDIEALLAQCFAVLSDTPVAVLWTGHSDSQHLNDSVKSFSRLSRTVGLEQHGIERALLNDSSGRQLDCGFRIRSSKSIN